MAEGNAQLILDIIAQADAAGISTLGSTARSVLEELVELANRVQGGGEAVDPQAMVAGIRRALGAIQDELHESAQRGFENVNLRSLETQLSLVAEGFGKVLSESIGRAMGETRGAEASRFGAPAPRAEPRRAEEIVRGTREAAERARTTYRIGGRFASREQYEALPEAERVRAEAVREPRRGAGGRFVSPEQYAFNQARQAAVAPTQTRELTQAEQKAIEAFGEIEEGLVEQHTVATLVSVMMKAALAAEQEYVEALNSLEVVTSGLAQARREALAPEQRSALVKDALSKAEEQNRRTIEGRRQITPEQQDVASQAELARRTGRALTTTGANVLAGPEDITARAGAVTSGRGFTVAADIENLRAIATNEDQILDKLIEQKVLRDTLNATIKEEADLQRGVVQQVSEAGRGGGGRGGQDHGLLGTLGSALGGFRRGQGARDVSGIGGLGAALVGGAIFNVGFAVQAGLTQAFTASEQLEKSLVELQQETISIGQGNQFESLRESILSTADATGVASTDVAALAQQFLGLYQNAVVAGQATQSAAEFVAESGVSAKTAGPDIAALAQNFGVTARQVGNAVVTSQAASGRSQQDILAAAADVAPVAANAGFNANQLFGIITAATQGSALSGTEVGEGLARVLPQLQTDLSKLARDGIKFSPEAMRGNVPQAFAELIGQYNQPGVNRQQIISDLGGARQAQFVASLASNPKAIADLNKDYTDNNALAARFAAVQETVGQALARVRQEAVTLAETLLQGGIGQGLASILSVGGEVLHFVDDLISGFDKFNRLMGGVPGQLAEVAVALGLLNRVGAFTAIGGLVEKLGALGGGALGVAGRIGQTGLPGVGAEIAGVAGRAGGRLGAIFGTPTVRAAARGAEAEAATVAPTARQRLGTLVGGAGVSVTAEQAAATEKQVEADTALVVTQKDLAAATQLRVEAEEKLLSLQRSQVATDEELTVAEGQVTAAKALEAETNASVGASGLLSRLGLGAGGLAGLAGPQALVTGGAIATYVAASALSQRSSQAYSRRVGGETTRLNNLSDQDVANLALRGSTRPVATRTSTLGYATDILTGGSPAADALRHLPVIGGLFGSASESVRQLARDQQVQRSFARGTNLGGFNPEGMTEDAVTALEKAVSPGLGKALGNALTNFENKGTVASYDALQKLYLSATRPGSAGAAAVEDAKAAAARQQTLSSFTDNAGSQFSSISDVASSFQSGYLSFSQALKDMTTVVNDDATATVAERQQRLSDTAAMKAFEGQVAQAGIAASQTAQQYLQGANPAQLLSSLAAQVTAAAPTLQPQQLVQYGAQLAQQSSAVNDFTIATTNSVSRLQGLLAGRGGATVTTQAAEAINAGDLAAHIAPQYPAIAAAVQRNFFTAIHNAQVDSAVQLAHRAREGGQDIAQGPGGIQAGVAVPAPPGALLNYQQDIADTQRITQLTQSSTQLRVAQAQARQANAVTVANIQSQGDTQVLNNLLAAQQAIQKAGGDASVLQPQIVAAETTVANDKVSQTQAVLSGIQQWGTFVKAVDFRDPVAQAKDGISQGLQEAAALHQTIPELEALAASGKGLSQGQAQALSDYQQGISDLFSAVQSNIQAVTSAAQAALSFQPLAADVRGVTGAAQNISAAGYTPQQLAGLVASGKATSQQAQLYQTYQSAVNQEFNDQTAISVQALTNAGNLASAQGNNVAAAVDQARAISAQMQRLASKGANAKNSQQYAQLQGQLQVANITIGQQQFEVGQAQFQSAEAVATSQGNSVQAANLALAAAQKAVAYWRSLGATPGASAQLAQALTAVTTARAAALNAQFEVGQASFQTAEAIATARGDPVGAADLAVKAAQSAVAYWRKLGARPGASAQLQQALTNLASAEGNALQARVSLAETLVQEEIANNQISISQGIAVFRAQQKLAIANHNALLAEQLQTDIQNLINQGNQNASFNLPGNLNLPTLYEVRRTEGTQGGANYYGNTGTVNVNINIGTNADTNAAVNQIMQAVGGPPTSGYNLPY